MKRIRARATRITGVVAAVGAFLLMAAGGAQASATGMSLQAEITQALEQTPGGVQISPNQVAWQNGKVVLTIPLSGEKFARAAAEPVSALGTKNCPYTWVCLYDGKDFEGRRLQFSECNEFNDLSSWDFNDKMTSWHNNQTSGTKARFYNWSNEEWVLVYTTPGAESWDGLVSSSINNKVDGIRAC
ncbi:peptidase inhibitor family I36 protein [Saccharothrix sp. AJ9571]|nr:peptidase inhibitor family I36 protein [Saccharothrix sp. AJ9571]